MKKQFKTFEEVKACVGQDVAISDWTTVTQIQQCAVHIQQDSVNIFPINHKSALYL